MDVHHPADGDHRPGQVAVVEEEGHQLAEGDRPADDHASPEHQRPRESHPDQGQQQREERRAHRDELHAPRRVGLVLLAEDLALGVLLHEGADEPRRRRVLLDHRGDVGHLGLHHLGAPEDLLAEDLHQDRDHRHHRERHQGQTRADREHERETAHRGEHRLHRVHEAGAEHHPHGVHVLGAAGEDVADPEAGVERRREPLQVQIEVPPQVVLRVPRDPDQVPAHEVAEDGGPPGGGHDEPAVGPHLAGGAGLERVHRPLQHLRHDQVEHAAQHQRGEPERKPPLVAREVRQHPLPHVDHQEVTGTREGAPVFRPARGPKARKARMADLRQARDGSERRPPAGIAARSAAKLTPSNRRTTGTLPRQSPCRALSGGASRAIRIIRSNTSSHSSLSAASAPPSADPGRGHAAPSSVTALSR